MWARSALVYRLNFVLVVVVGLLVNGVEFIGIVFMFMNVPALGGYSLPEVALLYGASGTALGLCDLLFGSIEKIGSRIRDGSLDTFLVRPVRLYPQAAADQFALRRLNRLIQAGGVLVYGLVAADVHWTWGRALMIPVMLICGTAIFEGVFTLGAAFQFWAQDAAEVQNAFTYGGNYLTQYPPTVFAKEMVRGAVFVIPLAFVDWWPALYVLGKPDPLGLPAWTHFLSPVVAGAFCGIAALAWRAAVRGYRSTGS
ncbi:ABC transporter permease [Mangrovactinospora gilvigrisea]|nr:ABC transporter permease [Mangrovactinospora gilvigrisea]